MKTFFVTGCAVLSAFLFLSCLASGLSWIGKPFPGFLLYRTGMFSPLILTGWTGWGTGLRYSDIIRSVNGETVTGAKDIYEAAGRVPPGTPLSYTVERWNRVLTVSVPTMVFKGRDLILTYGVFSILGVFFLAAGVIVALLRWEVFYARVFVANAFVMGAFFLSSFDFFTTYIFHRLTLVAVPVAPPLLILFTLGFRGLQAQLYERKALFFPFVVVPLVFLVSYQIFPSSPREYRIIDFLFYLYAVAAALTMIYVVFYLYRHPASPADAIRMRLMVIGAIIFVVASLPMIVAVIFFKVNLPIYISVLAVSVPVAIVVYSIVTLNIYEVSVQLRRALVYGAMTVLFAGAFGLWVLALNAIFARAISSYAPFWFPAYALVALILFEPVRGGVQRGIDRAFFRKRVVFRKVLTDGGIVLRALRDPDGIQAEFLNILTRACELNGACLLWRKASSDTYGVSAACGSMKGVRTAVEKGSAVLEEIERLRSPIHRIETREHLKGDADPVRRRFLESLDREMESAGAALVVPLVIHGSIPGILFLGEKRFQEGFTGEEIGGILSLTGSVGPAMENALLLRDTEERKRMDAEDDSARSYGMTIVPPRPPVFHGVDASGICLSGKGAPGDYFDLFVIDDDHLSVVMADAGDKGVSSILFLSCLKGALLPPLNDRKNPAALLAHLNAMVRGADQGFRVSFFYGIYSRMEGVFHYANAGHIPASLYCHTEETFRSVGGSSPPLGSEAAPVYPGGTVPLGTGDLLVFCSDGVLRARNERGEEFGRERLEETMRIHAALNPAAVQRKVVLAMESFLRGAEPAEDATLLILKVMP